MVDSARQLGYEDTEKHLLPLLEDLLTSNEPSTKFQDEDFFLPFWGLRQALVEQTPPFTTYFLEIGTPEAYNHILHNFVPTVAEMTIDSAMQVYDSWSCQIGEIYC